MEPIAPLKVRSFNPTPIPHPKLDSFQWPKGYERYEIEIGCGVGFHPIQRALSHPTNCLLAIEHTKTRFEKFKKRLLKHPNLSNLNPLHENAISVITHLIPDSSVDHYWLLYPNPYPKESQGNQRWHRMPFMQKLLMTLKPGGMITLATNEFFYAKEAHSYFENFWGLSLVSETHFSTKNPPKNEWGGVTHFEKKYLERGETCTHLEFRKNEPPIPKGT